MQKTKISERISKIIENERLSVRAFENIIGCSNGTIAKSIAKGSDINSVWVTRIALSFPRYSTDWLLMGWGAMYKTKVKTGADYEGDVVADQNNMYSPKTAKPQPLSNTIPLYMYSGVSAIFNKDKNIEPVDMILIPNIGKCDGALYVTGDSMYPLIKNGDIVVYRIVNDVTNILWGEMYLVNYEFEGEEFTTIRYIQKSEKEKTIQLVGYNPQYQPQEINIEQVRALALVKATIRYNIMQ